MSDVTGVDVVLGWSGPVLPIGRWAGDLDMRRFDNVSWPTLPLTLADNHMGSAFVGPVDSAEVLTVDQIAERVPLSDQDREEIGESALWFSGRFAPTEEGMKSAAQLAFWGRLPVSVEVRDGDYTEEVIEDDDGNMLGVEMDWSRTVVGAVALERLPAFAGAWIRPDREAAQFVPASDEDPPEDDDEDADEVDDAEEDELSVTLEALRSETEAFRQAGAGPHVYPARMFSRIDYGGPTRLSISKDGEVTGHAVLWGKTHRANSRWTAARNPRDDLSEWLVGATSLDSGEIIRTGVIVSDGLHGPAHQAGASGDTVRQLIESTACQVMTVNAWHDDHGIAVHGSTLPGVTPEQATRAMAGCPSVDERDLGDGRGFVTMGVLCVSTCGFSPASHVVTVEDGEPVRRLVASAAPERCGCGGTCGGDPSHCLGQDPRATPNGVPAYGMSARWEVHAHPHQYSNGATTSTTSGYLVQTASADPEPPKVVDLGAIEREDEAMRQARLQAAVAPKPGSKK